MNLINDRSSEALDRPYVGYALKFSMTDLMQGKHQDFYLPGYHPLMTLGIPMDEFWHGRTKIGIRGVVDENGRPTTLSVPETAKGQPFGYNPKTQTGLLVNPDHHLKVAERISRYIQENAIIISDPEGKAKLALEAQKTLTEKLTTAIKQYKIKN